MLKLQKSLVNLSKLCIFAPDFEGNFDILKF